MILSFSCQLQRVKIYVPRMLMMLVLITYSEPMEQDLDKQPDAASRTAVHWHLCRNIIVSCTIPAADRLVDVNIYQVVVHRVVLILPSETWTWLVKLLHPVHLELSSQFLQMAMLLSLPAATHNLAACRSLEMLVLRRHDATASFYFYSAGYFRSTFYPLCWHSFLLYSLLIRIFILVLVVFVN